MCSLKHKKLLLAFSYHCAPTYIPLISMFPISSQIWSGLFLLAPIITNNLQTQVTAAGLEPTTI